MADRAGSEPMLGLHLNRFSRLAWAYILLSYYNLFLSVSKCVKKVSKFASSNLNVTLCNLHKLAPSCIPSGN